MGTIIKWAFAILFAFIAVRASIQGIELLSLDSLQAGETISVSFLSFQISDSVNDMNLTSYIIGFFAAALVALILALGFIKDTFNSMKS